MIWAAAGILIAGVAFLLYRNNADFLAGEGEDAAMSGPTVNGPTPVHQAVVDVKSTQLPPQTESGTDPSRPSVLLKGIRCSLADRSEFTVFVSAEVFVSGQDRKEEVLAKREVLKTVVQKVFLGRTIDRIVIDDVRRELVSTMNRLLENEAVTDIEFREFRIE